MGKSNTRRYFEIAAVVATGLCKFVFVDLLPHKFWFIVAAILFWAGYVVWRCINDTGCLRDWGFRTDTFMRSFILLLPFGLMAVAGFSAYGLATDKMILHWHILPTLLLYPLWGIIQQFMIVALVAGNLDEINAKRARVDRSTYGAPVCHCALPVLAAHRRNVCTGACVCARVPSAPERLDIGTISRMVGLFLLLFCTGKKCLAGSDGNVLIGDDAPGFLSKRFRKIQCNACR